MLKMLKSIFFLLIFSGFVYTTFAMGGAYLLQDGVVLNLPWKLNVYSMAEILVSVDYTQALKEYFSHVGYDPVPDTVEYRTEIVVKEITDLTHKAAVTEKLSYTRSHSEYILATLTVVEYNSKGEFPAGIVEVSIGFFTLAKNNNWYSSCAKNIDYGEILYIPLWMTAPFFGPKRPDLTYGPEMVWKDFIGAQGYTLADVTWFRRGRVVDIRVADPDLQSNRVWMRLKYDLGNDPIDADTESTFRSVATNASYQVIPWTFRGNEQTTHRFVHEADQFIFPTSLSNSLQGMAPSYCAQSNRNKTPMVRIISGFPSTRPPYVIWDQADGAINYFELDGPLKYRPANEISGQHSQDNVTGQGLVSKILSFLCFWD